MKTFWMIAALALVALVYSASAAEVIVPCSEIIVKPGKVSKPEYFAPIDIINHALNYKQNQDAASGASYASAYGGGVPVYNNGVSSITSNYGANVAANGAGVSNYGAGTSIYGSATSVYGAGAGTYGAGAGTYGAGAGTHGAGAGTYGTATYGQITSSYGSASNTQAGYHKTQTSSTSPLYNLVPIKSGNIYSKYGPIAEHPCEHYKGQSYDNSKVGSTIGISAQPGKVYPSMSTASYPSPAPAYPGSSSVVHIISQPLNHPSSSYGSTQAPSPSPVSSYSAPPTGSYGPSAAPASYAPTPAHGLMPAHAASPYGSVTTSVSYGPSPAPVSYGPLPAPVFYGPSPAPVSYGPLPLSSYGPSAAPIPTTGSYGIAPSSYGPVAASSSYRPAPVTSSYGPALAPGSYGVAPNSYGPIATSGSYKPVSVQVSYGPAPAPAPASYGAVPNSYGPMTTSGSYKPALVQVSYGPAPAPAPAPAPVPAPAPASYGTHPSSYGLTPTSGSYGAVSAPQSHLPTSVQSSYGPSPIAVPYGPAPVPIPGSYGTSALLQTPASYGQPASAAVPVPVVYGPNTASAYGSPSASYVPVKAPCVLTSISNSYTPDSKHSYGSTSYPSTHSHGSNLAQINYGGSGHSKVLYSKLKATTLGSKYDNDDDDGIFLIKEKNHSKIEADSGSTSHTLNLMRVPATKKYVPEERLAFGHHQQPIDGQVFKGIRDIPEEKLQAGGQPATEHKSKLCGCFDRDLDDYI